MPVKILIVGLSENNATILTDALNGVGHVVYTHQNADDLKSVAYIHALDLVITDAESLVADENLRDLLHSNCGKRNVPIVAVTGNNSSTARQHAIDAGADALISTPINVNLFMAGVRADLRNRNRHCDLEPSEDTKLALGFDTYDQSGVPPAGRVEIWSDNAQLNTALRAQLQVNTYALTECTPLNAGMQKITHHRSVPDVVVINLRAKQNPTDTMTALRTIAELRSRQDTKETKIMMLFDPAEGDMAAMALDLGADDVLTGDAGAVEISTRLARLLRQRQAAQNFRERVRLGLQAAVTDPLTGLHNRRYAMSQMMHMSTVDDVCLAVMSVDVDRFKSFNDRFGHAAGDQLLITLADQLHYMSDADDMLARIGGEEFLLVRPVPNAHVARAMAQRVCDTIADTPFHIGNDMPPQSVTVSIGLIVACEPLSSSAEVADILKQADDALYEAKETGRNRVSFARPAA